MGALDNVEDLFTPLPFDLLGPYRHETHSTTCRKASFVSHNLMHATSDTRLHSILQEYGHTLVVALQGTRRPQRDAKPLNCSSKQNFTVYSAGYTKRSGEHAGVILAFNMKHVSPQSLKYYHISSDPFFKEGW